MSQLPSPPINGSATGFATAAPAATQDPAIQPPNYGSGMLAPQPPASAATTPPTPPEAVYAQPAVQTPPARPQYTQDQLENLQLRQQLQQILPAFQQYQRVAPHLTEYEAWLAQREEAAAPAPGSAAPAPRKWSPPEFDPAWEGMVRFDEQVGTYVPASPWINPVVADKFNTYRKWQSDAANRIVSDPMSVLDEAGFQERLDAHGAALIQKFHQMQSEQRDTDEARQFLAQNQHSLFMLDTQGQPVVNPYTGEAHLTAIGATFKHYLDQTTEYSMTNKQRREYAVSMTQRDVQDYNYRLAMSGQYAPAAAAPLGQALPAPPSANTPPRDPATGQFLSQAEATKAYFLNRAQAQHQTAAQAAPPPGAHVPQTRVVNEALSGKPMNGAPSFMQMARETAAAMGVGLN